MIDREAIQRAVLRETRAIRQSLSQCCHRIFTSAFPNSLARNQNWKMTFASSGENIFPGLKQRHTFMCMSLFETGNFQLSALKLKSIQRVVCIFRLLLQRQNLFHPHIPCFFCSALSLIAMVSWQSNTSRRNVRDSRTKSQIHAQKVRLRVWTRISTCPRGIGT